MNYYQLTQLMNKHDLCMGMLLESAHGKNLDSYALHHCGGLKRKWFESDNHFKMRIALDGLLKERAERLTTEKKERKLRR